MNLEEAKQSLASALGRVPSGLLVLTIARGDVETGMLASWVQQCSFEPPMVTVAVKKDRKISELLADESPFTLNILDESQTGAVRHFGKGFALNEPAFDGLEITRDENNGPVLANSLAYLSCRVRNRVDAGDHHVLLAQVEHGRVLGEGKPMIHVRKNGLRY